MFWHVVTEPEVLNKLVIKLMIIIIHPTEKARIQTEMAQFLLMNPFEQFPYCSFSSSSMFVRRIADGQENKRL